MNDILILRINKTLKEVVDAINNGNYTNTIKYLAELGNYVQRAISPNKDVDEPILRTQVSLFKNKTEKNITAIGKLPIETSYRIENVLAFFTFIKVWQDDELKLLSENEPTLLSGGALRLKAKINLNASTRQSVSIGLLAILQYVERRSINHTVNVEQLIKNYENQALIAIKSYQTILQKILTLLGKGIAALVAISSGLMTSVAVLTVLGTSWPVLVGAMFIFLAGTYVNWSAFKIAVPSLFIAIVGKDKLMAGIVNWLNLKGKYQPLSIGRKIALSFALLLSASVGITFGALTFSAVIGLGQAGVFSLLTAGSLSVILPPVGIVLAMVTAIGMFALMAKSFINLLQTENLKAALLRPFYEVAKVFYKEDKTKNDKVDILLKGATYTVLSLVIVAGLIGLTILSYTCSLSITGFLTSVTHVAPNIAANIGYTVGLGFALLGQVPFILEAAGLMVAKVASSLFQKNLKSDEETVTNVSKLGTRLKNIIGTSVITLSKIINAVGNGMLAVPTGAVGWLAQLSVGTATLNSLNFGFSGDTVSDKEAEAVLKEASTMRINNLLNLTRTMKIETMPVLDNDKKSSGASSYPNSNKMYEANKGNTNINELQDELFIFKNCPFPKFNRQ